MKSFSFSIGKIDDPVLCKVITTPDFDLGCYDFYFVGDRIPYILSDRGKQNLTSYTIPAFFLPATFSDGSSFELKKGDIVLFNPSGMSTVVYESISRSNSFFLTERCNCKCIMCAQPPKASPDSCDLASAITELLDNHPDCIGITGGEPTLAWEGLLNLINNCREKFPNMQIQLLSNARLLKEFNRTKSLAEAGGDNLTVCVPIYCEISHIHDMIVSAKGAYWETVQGIYNLERLNIPVEIRTVVIKQNYRRLPQWSEFIYRFFPFAMHVAIMGLEPIGLALKNLDEIWIDPIDYVEYLEKSIRILKRGDIAISIYNHQLCTLPSHLWGFAKKSISEWKNIYFEKCDHCVVKSDCAGFFQSSKNKMSRGINPVI
jgi:His-Xaa-Ser system radical SAM maturase HxsC